MPIVAPKAAIKLEPVSSRLVRELIFPDKKALPWKLYFSPDGKRLIAGDYPGGTIMLWNTADGKQLRTFESGRSTRGSAEYYHVSPDFKTLFYVTPEKQELTRFEKDGKRLIRWKFFGEVRACNIETGQIEKVYRHNPPGNIRRMSFAENGRKFLTFQEPAGDFEHRPQSTVSIWDVVSGKNVTLQDHVYHPGPWMPDGKTLVATAVDADNYTVSIHLLDISNGKQQLTIPVPEKNSWAGVEKTSPDGRLLIGTHRVFDKAKRWDHWTATFKWWDTVSGKEIAVFPIEKNDMFSTAEFSPDGRWLAALNWRGKIKRLLLFNVAERKITKSISIGETVNGEILVAAGQTFSPDGNWLALCTQKISARAGDNTDARDEEQSRIHLIDVSVGEIRETIIAPQGFTRSLRFSPDGQTLASGGLGRVLLWDLSSLPGSMVRK